MHVGAASHRFIWEEHHDHCHSAIGRADLTFRERFGGVDTPSAIMGMFAAVGVLIFIGALVGAGANELDYQLNAIDVEGNVQELLTAGVILAVVVVFVSFFLGGWAAARMARYDGGINGLAAAMWMLLLVAVFPALGSMGRRGSQRAPDRRAPRLVLPDPGVTMLTTVAIIAAIAAAAATLVGGFLGGLAGERYHREADATLVGQVAAVETADDTVVDAD